MMHKKQISKTQVIQPKILYYGTPVVLLTTFNEDQTSNITPMSSAWALGNRIILGLGEGGKGLESLIRHSECVVNLPDSSLWESVELLAPLTGKTPIPEYKKGVFRYEKDKFAAAGLTPVKSTQVEPDRIAECPIQIEATVKGIRIVGEQVRFGIIEVEALVVHAHDRIIVGANHVDPVRWNPLIYNFRHYFGLGDELGKTFRAEI
ncbi:flavin reductase family protein [Ferroacidibacillus organovorans]|uniref:Flavin reductase like domain-containing protein n=1 Tax=Ferroacidibacillus organovorans TaxID=1765683 RepID=A0A853K776_9BACL|nr:flavin reductase family protein [Ferroacidibacillus organovorans]KYP79548.1 hypothetical protein AYJ22_14330 [Ferroacidibacillus organovorans]OAG91382.1 hypothetical protein AYW79_13710 [Ferroacidibacillus organovorans]